MRDSALPSVHSRELARREIENQVQSFLNKGGEIEKLSSLQKDVKPVGTVWRQPMVGSFE